jgi:hypothetical protein
MRPPGTIANPQLSPKLGAEILSAIKDKSTTPEVFMILARLSAAEGAESTAQALRQRATAARRTRPASVNTAESGRTEKLERPAAPAAPVAATATEEVPAAKLGEFASVLRANRSPDADAKGRVGVYAMSMQRLADLGIVKNPHKTGPRGQSTWTAEWSERLPREKFVADEDLQAAALGKSLRLYTDEIRGKFGGVIGKKLGETTVTLSGLLAVAHVAGIRGLETWLRDAGVRAKFPGTTGLFNKANGLF